MNKNDANEPLKQTSKATGVYPSLEKTTHIRILKETKEGAKLLAERWGCTTQEVYRWLVKMALEGKATPDEVTKP